MLALASGATLEELRWRVSASLFAILQALAGKIGKTEARQALSDHFDIDETEWVEERSGPVVYGASLLNFPRELKRRSGSKLSQSPSSRYNPVSSFSFR